MPEYTYECKQCQATKSVIRTITEKETIPECKECETQMTRRFGVAAVTFKGPGFYRNERN